MHDVLTIGDWDDIETSLLEDITLGRFEMKQMETVFTAKRDDRGYWYALLLTPNASQPVEIWDGGFESSKDLQERMKRKYGQSTVFLSNRQFQAEIEQRQIHTPEMIDLLQKNGEPLGLDLSHSVVYGAPMRPMSSIWARIDNAVFIQTSPSMTGYHTYVAVPAILDKEVIEKYELVFVSHPQ